MIFEINKHSNPFAIISKYSLRKYTVGPLEPVFKEFKLF